MSKEKPEILCQFFGSMASNWASFQQTNSVTVVSVFVFAIYGHDLTKCRAPHTFVNMMVTNDVLMEKYGVILHVGSLNQKTSWTSHLVKDMIAGVSWTQIGGRGKKICSLLSAHHLIGKYFLTAESDKRMCMLTRLYGIRHSLFLTTVLAELTSCCFRGGCVQRSFFKRPSQVSPSWTTTVRGCGSDLWPWCCTGRWSLGRWWLGWVRLVRCWTSERSRYTGFAGLF